MFHNMPALGIRFDIGKVPGYGIGCWEVFWRAVDLQKLGGAHLFEGDTHATLTGSENVYCIAVQSISNAALGEIRAAIAQSTEFQNVAASPKFVEGNLVVEEPLPDAGQVDSAGNLVGGAFTSSTAFKRVYCADTTEATFAKAQSKVPTNSVVMDKKELVAPELNVIIVEAFDEQGARELAKREIDNTVIVKGVTLISSGKKGFLGIGKKPNRYEVQVFQQAIVGITYKKEAKICGEIGEIEKIATRECAICGKSIREDKMKAYSDFVSAKKTYYCSDECWFKRGRIVGSNAGVGCPFYNKDKMCVPPDKGIAGAVPCSLGLHAGGFYNCEVYPIHSASAKRLR